MRHAIRTLLACALIGLAGSAVAHDTATIEALNARFIAAFERGDMAAVADFYTDNAYLLPAGAPLAKGRAAIQAFWTAAARDIAAVRLSTVEVRPLGETVALEIGRFSLKTRATPPAEMAGKYAVVWRREADGWRLDADTWNADQ